MNGLPAPPARWWSRPRTLVQAVAALGAALATAPSMGVVHGDPELSLLAVPCTALLSVLLIRRALHARSLTGVALRCLVGGVLAGALNQGLVLFIGGIVGAADAAVFLLFMGTLIGLVYVGGPLGFAYGLGFAPLVGSVTRAERRPSHLGDVQVRLLAGVWLALVAGVVSAVVRGPQLLAGAVAVLLGALLAGSALYHRIRCARWLRRVRAGAQPG